MRKVLLWFPILIFLGLLFSVPIRAQQCPTQTANVGFQIPNIGNTTTWGTCLNSDLAMLDTLLGGVLTLPTGATPTLPLVSTNFVTANITPTAITNFVGGYPGETIRIICGTSDNSTSMVSGTNLNLVTSWSCPTGTAISFTLIGGIWTEVSRGGGAPGAAGPAGPGCTSFLGVWSSGTTYTAGQCATVTATGTMYISLAGSNLNNNPPSSPTFWYSVAGYNQDGTWGSNNRFKGPDPYVDITALGARPVSISGTANCNGTTTVASAPPTFVNGDGIVLYQCGPAPGMSTPSAPTSVISGGSNTETVPDAVLTSVTGGANTYNYLLVGRDESGGLTAAGPATSVTTSQFATLGQQTFTITSESQTGNTLTITLSSAANITAGNLVHAKQSSNAALSGWFIVSVVSGGGTVLTINNVPTYFAATIASTGGTLTFMAGNQVAWTGAANVWEYLICGKRPGDGSYHIIGSSLPNNKFPSATSTFPSSYVFTDFGATMTSTSNLPSYIADANCTAGAAQNQYLSTTVVSGGGTSTLVLNNAATQTVTSATVKQDNGPALLAAATFAVTTGARVYIPPTGTFQINSFTDISGQSAPLDIAGNLTLNETLHPWNVLKGSAGNSAPQFGQVYTSTVSAGTAWPGIWAPGLAILNVDSLNFNCTSTQCISFLWDASSNPQNGYIKNSNFSVDTYSGIGLMIRPQAFNYVLDTLSFNDGGPAVDTTWTPALYVASCQGGCNGNTNDSTGVFQVRHLTFARRLMYTLMWGSSGANGPSKIDGLYAQGGIMPAFAIQSTNGGSATIALNDVSDDSSAQPLITNLGGVGLTLAVTKMGGMSSETSGPPSNISGVAPQSISVLNDTGTTGFAGLTQQRGTYLSLFNSAPRSFYANDFFDTGLVTGTTNTRGILDSFSPLVSRSGSFVGLALPVQGTPTVGGAGPEVTGVHTYCLAAVGWNGGWGPSSCQTLNVVSNNVVINFTWTAVANGQGYVMIRDGRNCVPASNANCLGLSFSGITTTSGSYSGSVAGCCSNPVNPDMAGDGISGFNASGLFGPRLRLLSGAFKGDSAATLTANRTWTDPDATGTRSLAAVQYCGATSGATQNCAETVQNLPIMVWGEVTLNSATTQSITTLPFTDALFSCSGSDLTTTTGSVFFNTYTLSSVTIGENGGTTTDHLRWMCLGH